MEQHAVLRRVIPRSPRRRLVWASVVVSVVALSAAAGSLATNYETYYLGTSTNYGTLYSDAPKTTASTALRDNNNIDCEYDCFAHVYYYSASTGSFCVVHTDGWIEASCTSGSGGHYVYSRCIAENGNGFPADCWTDWHA
jgi:hypothetical protein